MRGLPIRSLLVRVDGSVHREINCSSGWLVLSFRFFDESVRLVEEIGRYASVVSVRVSEYVFHCETGVRFSRVHCERLVCDDHVGNYSEGEFVFVPCGVDP